MDSHLKELSQTLLEIYKKNISFLKENFPQVYEKVDKLSEDINCGKRKEKYTLEYIDGYFDILNHENNGFYYHKNSYEDADERKEIVNFTNENSLDLLRRNPYTNKLLSSDLYQDAMPIIDFINEKVDFDKIEYQKIFKFIFISTGLGFHINEIHKKLDSYTTLIIEPELEIFRLSLFVTDYTILHDDNRTLFLSIEDDRLERYAVLSQFATHHEYMNYNVKYYNLLSSNDYLHEEVVKFFGRNTATSFPYKLIVQNLHRTISFIKNGDRFLSAPSAMNDKILQNKRILIVCAGPSLDSYIAFIKEHQEKFIIVCVDVILKKLEKNGITPDIVTSIDPDHICADFLDTEDKDFLNNSCIILLSQQHERVLEVLKDKNYYFSQVMPLISEIGYFGSVPNVGTFSFDMSVYLGGTELYIIGNDAAFDQETGSRYTQDSSYIQKETLEKKEDTLNEYSLDDIIEVEGNLQKKIKTNHSLLNFKFDFETAINEKKNSFDFKIYNLSNGVKIEGFTPMTFEEINEKVKTFEDKSHDLKKDFDKISETFENFDIDKHQKTFNLIINRVKKFQKNRFKTKDEFLEAKLDLMIWILEKTNKQANNVFANIFLRYTALVDIYVNFMLNIKQKNLHSKESINAISQMWAKGVLVLFKDMKKSIKI